MKFTSNTLLIRLSGVLFILTSLFFAVGYLFSGVGNENEPPYVSLTYFLLPSILLLINGILLLKLSTRSITLLQILIGCWLLIFVFLDQDPPPLIFAAICAFFALYLSRKKLPLQYLQPNNPNDIVLRGSRYYHYKNPNQFYTVVGNGVIEATGEPGIIYQAEYGDKTTWIRAAKIFLEEVEWEGKKVPRFTRIS